VRILVVGPAFAAAQGRAIAERGRAYVRRHFGMTRQIGRILRLMDVGHA
jgi:hypothetical protein